MKHMISAVIACTLTLLIGLASSQTTGVVSNVQLKNRSGDPVQMETANIPLAENGSSVSNPSVRFRNTGKIACKAYSIALLFSLSDGTHRRMVISEDRAAMGGPGANRGIQPGQVMDRASTGSFPLKSGVTITEVAVSLDYAELADGSHYGPDPDGMAYQFAGRRAVVQGERTRLLLLYQQKGADALLKDLQGQ